MDLELAVAEIVRSEGVAPAAARLATALVELLRATDRELVAHGHDGLDIEASAHQIIDEALRPPLRVVE